VESVEAVLCSPGDLEDVVGLVGRGGWLEDFGAAVIEAR